MILNGVLQLSVSEDGFFMHKNIKYQINFKGISTNFEMNESRHWSDIRELGDFKEKLNKLSKKFLKSQKILKVQIDG